MECARLECGNEAEVVPVLLLYAAEDTEPAKAKIDLPICGECAVQSKIADFVSDKGWAQIVGSFKAMGKVPPKRELTDVRFARL